MPEGSHLSHLNSLTRGDVVIASTEDEAGTIMVKRYRLVLPGKRLQHPNP